MCAVQCFVTTSVATEKIHYGASCDTIQKQVRFSHTSQVIPSLPHIGVCVAHQRAVVSCTAYLHTRDTIQLTHNQQQPHTVLTE